MSSSLGIGAHFPLADVRRNVITHATNRVPLMKRWREILIYLFWYRQDEGKGALPVEFSGRIIRQRPKVCGNIEMCAASMPVVPIDVMPRGQIHSTDLAGNLDKH